MTAGARTVILVCGASGSGKSHLAKVTGAPQLRLDDFYHDIDCPNLPTRDGYIDWDDAAAWDCEAAVAALRRLCTEGEVSLPKYDKALSKRVGEHTLSLGDEPCVIAEGIFATELLAPATAAGLKVTPILLTRPRVLVFLIRLIRDLYRGTKSPGVLFRRGIVLYREEPALREHAVSRGFEPVTMRQAIRRVRDCYTRSQTP